MTQRVALLVYVDLDPVPGVFHTERSARDSVRAILERNVPHYDPSVYIAPGNLQVGVPQNLKG